MDATAATPTTAPAVVHRMTRAAAVTRHRRSRRSWSAQFRYHAQLVSLGPPRHTGQKPLDSMSPCERANASARERLSIPRQGRCGQDQRVETGRRDHRHSRARPLSTSASTCIASSQAGDTKWSPEFAGTLRGDRQTAGEKNATSAISRELLTRSCSPSPRNETAHAGCQRDQLRRRPCHRSCRHRPSPSVPSSLTSTAQRSWRPGKDQGFTRG